jgi:hypothetical protein
MFGKSIEYNPSKTYGIFNSRGQYGRLPVEKTLPRFADIGDQTQFLQFLSDQIKYLDNRLKNGSALEALADEGIIEVTGLAETDEIRRGYIQNTLDLFRYMAEKLDP